MNVLYMLSDQHNPEYTGCFGRSITRTPNIDRLAKLGTSFDSTYCLSPICSPTRAAMITGRYVHEISVWDNAVAYNGVPISYGHYFEDQGIQAQTIRLYGNVEIAPASGVADTIVDLVDTGGTLDANGLVPIREIFRATARLIVNRSSLKTKHDRVYRFVSLLKKVCRSQIQKDWK